MKKVLMAVLVVFFATALYAGTDVDPLAVGTQAARDKQYKDFGNPQVQFDLSGEFDVRGYYWDNATILKDRKIDTDYYRGYMDLWPKLKIGDTQVITKLEMVDQNPWAPYLNTPTNNYSDSFDKSFNNLSLSKNNNISVERAYIHHNFNDSIFLEAGLMDGQWWGTSFWDNQQPRYRIKIQDNKTPVGVVGALVEKDAELGKNVDGTYSYGGQRDDYDAYAVYGVTKAGDIYISPLLFYVKDSSFTTLAAKGVATPLGAADLYLTGLDQGKNGLTVIYYALSFNGKLGPLSMEAEVGLKDYRAQIMEHLVAPGTLNDLNAALIPATLVKNNYDEWGAYLNLWNDLDFGRVGAWAAYGSYDRKGGPLKTGDGMDFWDDFKSNLILGDEIGFGSSSAQDLVGMSEIKPYVKYVKLGPDKLTGSASLGFIKSNQSGANALGEHSIYQGVTAWELDLGVQYKLTKNLLYKIDAGYAKVDTDKKYWKDANGSNQSPDPIWLVRDEIVLTF